MCKSLVQKWCSNYNIHLFRVSLQPGKDEGAINFYGQMTGAGIIHGEGSECGGDSFAAQLVGDLGMHEDQFTFMEAIFEKSQLAFHYYLKLLLLFVVDDVKGFHGGK